MSREEQNRCSHIGRDLAYPNNAHCINVPGYQFHGYPRPHKKGGRVGFLINDQLQYKARSDLIVIDDQIEHGVIELKLKKKLITVNAIYRPPNTNQDHFLTWFQSLNDILMKNHCKDFVVGMDHNMDLLKHDQNLKMQIFFETMLDNFIMLCITRPTRITKDMATLIDNI